MAKNTEKNPAYVAAGIALRKARGQRTVKEIAAALQISGGRYQHWEAGDNAPRHQMWPRLTRALGIDVSELYGVSDKARATLSSTSYYELGTYWDRLPIQMQHAIMEIARTTIMIDRRTHDGNGKDHPHRRARDQQHSLDS